MPELLRTSATIMKYYGGNEEVYVSPKGCTCTLDWFPLVIHNDAFPYDISLVTVLPSCLLPPVISRITHLEAIVELSENWSG